MFTSSHSWCSLRWFPKAFAVNSGWWSPRFAHIRIGICLKIKSEGSFGEATFFLRGKDVFVSYQQALALFNRNNYSYSPLVCSEFLSNLRKHHSAVSYLNFVLHSEQTLVEKDSPVSLGTMKSSFSEGQTTLVVFNLF